MNISGVILLLIFSLCLYAACGVLYQRSWLARNLRETSTQRRWFLGLGLLADLVLVLALVLGVLAYLVQPAAVQAPGHSVGSAESNHK